jgi:AcrR family transcriptional regulator
VRFLAFGFLTKIIWYIYQMQVKFMLPTTAALSASATARERILTAAVELLHTEGFSVLTQQAVAAKAGVRQSHVTYYFPSRNDLLRDTAQFGCASMLAPIEGAVASGLLTRENLREALLPDVSDRAFIRLMIGLTTASDEDHSIRAWLSEFDEGVLRRIQAAFAAVDVHFPDEMLHVLHALFVGSVNLDMAQQTAASLAGARRNVQFFIDYLLREYGAPQPTRAAKAKSARLIKLPKVAATVSTKLLLKKKAQGTQHNRARSALIAAEKKRP